MGIATSLPQLKMNNVEIIEAPGYAGEGFVESGQNGVFSSADLVVFVTDCNRQLSEKSELQLLELVQQKQPFVVLSQIDRVEHQPMEAAEMVADLRARLKKASGRSRLFGYSNQKKEAAAHLKVPGLLSLDTLKKALLLTAADTETKLLYKYRTAVVNTEEGGKRRCLRCVEGKSHLPCLLFVADLAKLLKESRTKKLLSTEAAKKTSASLLEIQKFEVDFLQSFRSLDVSIIQREKVKVSSRVSDFFTSKGLYTLLFNREQVGLDLYSKIFASPLLQDIELQVSFVCGRLNEISMGMKTRFAEEFRHESARIREPNLGLTNSLAGELDTLRWILDSHKVVVDTNTLTSTARAIVDEFDGVKKAFGVQEAVTRSVNQSALVHGAAVVLGAGAVLADVEPTIALAGVVSAASLSLGGLAWVALAWRTQRQKLIRSTADLYDRVEADISVIFPPPLSAVVFPLIFIFFFFSVGTPEASGEQRRGQANSGGDRGGRQRRQ